MRAIMCVDRNWAIGKNGDLLVSIPGDQRFFREKTYGNVVVMGRKTFESLPGGRPLEGRTNIVLTRNRTFCPDGVTVVHDKSELLDELRKYDTDDIYVIGGAEIYALMLPYCDTAYVTHIDFAYQADTYLTNMDCLPEWELTEESEEQTYFDLEYTFRTYRKKYRTAAFPE